MGMPKRTLTQLKKMYEDQGCEVTRGKGGGWRVRTPHGGIIQVHSSPKDVHEQLAYLRQNTRRAGLDWTL